MERKVVWVNEVLAIKFRKVSKSLNTLNYQKILSEIKWKLS